MAFVAYLVSLVAAFVGVLALYGVLLKPLTGKPPPAPAVAAEQADPETTSSTRARPAPAPVRKRDGATAARQRGEANEARAEEPSDPVPPANSRRSPVRAGPGEGLRLEPERCWIVTDRTRGFGYYGECR